MRNTYTQRGTHKPQKDSKLEAIIYKQKTSMVKKLPKQSNMRQKKISKKTFVLILCWPSLDMGPGLHWFLRPVRLPWRTKFSFGAVVSWRQLFGWARAPVCLSLSVLDPVQHCRICAGPGRDATASEFLCVSVLSGVLTEFLFLLNFALLCLKFTSILLIPLLCVVFCFFFWLRSMLNSVHSSFTCCSFFFQCVQRPGWPWTCYVV